MGRGRAKAKQTKVARDLKYRTFDTDFSSLERELRGEEAGAEIPDSYADYDEAPDDVDDAGDYSAEGRRYG
jgi:hypothetical protein